MSEIKQDITNELSEEELENVAGGDVKVYYIFKNERKKEKHRMTYLMKKDRYCSIYLLKKVQKI